MSATISTSGPISVPVAIVLGLLSSFVQSLGLTIQRKSHLQNAALVESKQKSEWKRPLWLVGFVIFIIANIGGTVFQIGALPIVMLAPLGAVSLLYNALLARFILDDFFSRYMIVGTALIAVGAVLIGYFGVVQEPTHSLDDLLALYARPPFIAFASVFALAFIGVLALAHLAEWQLRIRLFRPRASLSKTRSGGSTGKRKRPKRRWSAPSLAPLVEVSESSSGIATPVLEIADEAARRGLPVDRVLAKKNANNAELRLGRGTQRQRSYGTFQNSNSSTSSLAPSDDLSSLERSQSTSAAAAAAAIHDPTVRRTCLGLAVAYGGASGTLSGICLLLAKSGVELLVMTIGGENQFNRWQSWLLVIIMLAAALLQLWYLNKSLRLADPTLVCPLAFCFYNTSSIMLGLVYFNQLGSLPALNLVLVVLGIAILLAGVWTVSLHGGSGAEDDGKEEEQASTLDSEHIATLSASSSLEAIKSPVEVDNATERDALLANAGGIAGPHLPPPKAATISTVEAPSSAGSMQAAAMSPSSSNSSNGSAKGIQRRRRSGSGSYSSIGGLGMHVPGLPVQTVCVEDGGDAGLADESAAERAASPGVRVGGPDDPDSGLYSPRSLQRRRHFYETLLERGLSVGISPSSPGFHLRSSFEEEPPPSPQARRMRRPPRRTFSEADAEIVASNAGEPGDESAWQEEESGTSTWDHVAPALDFSSLSERLNNMTRRTRGWFGGFFQRF